MLLKFDWPPGRFLVFLLALGLAFFSARADAALFCATIFAPSEVGSDQQSVLWRLRIQTEKVDGLDSKTLAQVENELEALRQSAYQLQALFKIYSLHPEFRELFSQKDRKRIEGLRVHFKKFEQILGEIKNAKNMPLMAKKLAWIKGFKNS